MKVPLFPLQKRKGWVIHLFIFQSCEEFVQMLTKNCMNYLLWPKLVIRSLAAGIPGQGRKSLFWGRHEVKPSICFMCSPTCHIHCIVSAENRHFLSKTGQTHRLKPPIFLHFTPRGKDAMCWISSAAMFRFTDSELPAVKRTWRSFVIPTPSSIMEGQQQDSSRRLNHSHCVNCCLGEVETEEENKWIQSRPTCSKC